MPRPKRRYVITVTVQGDTWEDALRELHDTTRHVEQHGPDCKMISGGYSTSAVVDVEHDPTMDGDRYRELVTELAEQEREKEC